MILYTLKTLCIVHTGFYFYFPVRDANADLLLKSIRLNRHLKIVRRRATATPLHAPIDNNIQRNDATIQCYAFDDHS